MASNPLRERLAEDIRQAMAATEPTADEVARRSKRGPPIQGIKASELAARLGVGYDALLDWLRGDTEPSRENRLKLCGFLGITEDVFIGRYHLGSVGPAPNPNPTIETGRVEELAAEVAQLRLMVRRLEGLLGERGETG